MDNEKYKLIGICNPFNIVPFMVKPVFEDAEGNLYLGYIYDKETKEYSPYIRGFTRMSNQYINYVKNLSDCTINSDALGKEYYSTGDLSPCAIELGDDILYVNQMDKYLEFLKEYKNKISLSFEFNGKLIKIIEGEIDFIEPLVNKYKNDNKNNNNKAENLEKRLIKIIEDSK